MKFLCALCVLCVLCGLVSSAVAIDREAFTFAKYDLEIRLEAQQQRLGARGKITLRNDSAQPQKIAVLQISSSLAWRSIKVDGKAVQFVSQPYASDIDHTGALSEAIVTLPAEIKPKDSVEVEIGYEGTIVQDGTRLTQIGIPEDIARHSSWDQISPAFTAVRGAGYVAWYPIATESADFSEGNSMFQVGDRWRARESNSSMKLWISTDEGHDDARVMVLCNGDGISGDTRGGSPHFHWAQCEYDPFGLNVPAFASGKLNERAIANGAIPLSIYFLGGHEAGASAYTTAADSTAKFVGDWFGQFKIHVAMIDLPNANAAPFESGNMLFVRMKNEDAELVEINLVHELVHAAFTSPRPWIHEGLAHFAEAIYREQKQDGRAAALDFLNLHRTTFVEAEKDIATSQQKDPGQPLVTTFDESYYRSKAAYVWWMLRDTVGEDALKQAIHNYRAADDKDPKYMEHLVATAAKRDLGWFFDDWVYNDRGLPDLRVVAAHPWKGAKETQIVTVTVENLGRTGAEVPFTIRFAGGEITRRIEVRAKSTATTRVEVARTATEVVVNDGSVPETDLTNNVFKITEP
jgi:aminopeptidase N